MRRSERLITLLDLLHAKAGMDAEGLARLTGVSERTLQRDLDALGAAGFPVYFDRGYRLAAPTLLPPVTLSVDEALALGLAAEAAAPRVEPAAARALASAVKRLKQAQGAKPPDVRVGRQLSLTLADQHPHLAACAAALGEAIAERRTVKLIPLAPTGEEGAVRRLDPYRLLPAEMGLEVLGYCHDRRRLVRLPLRRFKEIVVLQRRFQPLHARLLERHLHRADAESSGVQWVRLASYPPLAQALLENPPVGSLTWEEGQEGSVIFLLGAMRPADLVPWILACGEGIEVLEPLALRREIERISRAALRRYAPAGEPRGAPGDGQAPAPPAGPAT
jgi:predicted DNA-binding transcriptional regulator YafY